MGIYILLRAHRIGERFRLGGKEDLLFNGKLEHFLYGIAVAICCNEKLCYF